MFSHDVGPTGIDLETIDLTEVRVLRRMPCFQLGPDAYTFDPFWNRHSAIEAVFIAQAFTATSARSLREID
jgi:hypothetical protein